MKARIEAGTDVAMLGAWDASRNSNLLGTFWGRDYDAALKADSETGHLFFISTGADCGGPIDVLVEESPTPELRRELTPLPGEFLLRIPSGKLVVGGVEDYRSPNPKITGERSVLPIPTGDYLLTAYRGPEENIPVTASKDELRRRLGVEDFQYYERVERTGCFGYLILLLIPVLWPLIGWKWSAAAAVLVMLLFFSIREYWFLRRSQRYQRINKLVNDACAEASATGPPIFLFELHSLANGTGKSGGSIRLG